MASLVAALVRRANAQAALLAAPLVEGNMTSTVRITRGGDQAPTWNEETSTVIPGDEDEIWGPDTANGDPVALIKTVSGPVTMALADEPQYFQSTFVQIPLRARQPEVDDIIQVLTSPDAHLVNRYYRVVDLEHAGQLPLYHRMQVVGIQPGRYWRPAG